jgi:predicted Rossmann fold flavoprotein
MEKVSKQAGETMVIGIIGGGASGMAAALAAAENPGAQVLLFERQARLGRKLQATGNGRCNLTNLHAMEGGYHGSEPQFSKAALSAFDVEKTLGWFRALGLFTVAEDSGRVYPYSDQANSVVDVLRFALEKPNIRIFTGFEVTKVKKTPTGFSVENGEETHDCHKLIVACGGLAGTKLGGSMSGYKLLSKFGHRATRLRPALVQVKTSWGGVAGLKGVRANCKAEILHDGAVFAASQGELQFTEVGLSGPVMFEISRDVCQGGGDWSCRLDFLPHVDAASLEAELVRRRQTNLNVDELLTGILHNRLGRVLTKAAGVRSTQEISDLSNAQIKAVCHAVKAFEVALTEPLGMDSAQVTAGGVLTAGFDENTMESKTVPGLYACGEVLDIDGDCGGYNLQWAWSSGRMAGLHAGKDSK